MSATGRMRLGAPPLALSSIPTPGDMPPALASLATRAGRARARARACGVRLERAPVASLEQPTDDNDDRAGLGAEED